MPPVFPRVANRPRKLVGWVCSQCGYAVAAASTLDPSPVCTGPPRRDDLTHEALPMRPLYI